MLHTRAVKGSIAAAHIAVVGLLAVFLLDLMDFAGRPLPDHD
jgi:hypothetical protein